MTNPIINTDNIPAPHSSDDAVSMREIFDILWTGKIVIAITTALAIAAATLYLFIASPVYQALGSIQVEKEKSGMAASMDQLSSVLGVAPTEAAAEMAILKSRIVLSAVNDTLKLNIVAKPHYFTPIGEAVSRKRGADKTTPLPPLFGMSGFAWGGEHIEIGTFEIANAGNDVNLSLTLIDQHKYHLTDIKGNSIGTGKVGEMFEGKVGDKSLRLFVREISARPGTSFDLQLLTLQTVLAQVFAPLTLTEQPKDSGVITIQFEDSDPKHASDVVNEVQKAYLRQNVERHSAQAQQSLDFLKEQLPGLKEKVDAAQASLNRYQQQKGSVDVAQETKIFLDRAVALESERQRLTQEREVALQKFTDKHPVLLALADQIRSIDGELGSLKKQTETLPQTQQEILVLMRDLEVNVQLYTTLLNSSQQLQVARAGTVGNVRIIDSALPPLSPARPAKTLILAVSILVGLFLGVAVVFGMRQLLRGVDKPEELERALGMPTYAAIPWSAGQRELVRKLRNPNKPESNILAISDPKDLAIEAIRGLRTSLHFAMMDAPNNVVMLTGPIASLGKSFVSINLAAVIASTGKRTLLIDADLRRGILHRYAGVPNSIGLSDFIVASATKQQVIHSTPVDNLSFVPTGSRPPNPSEILLSERFTNFIKEVSAEFDYVLIDTPPALPVTDAVIVGRLAGCTMLVLKSAEHPLRSIEETLRRLRNGGVSVKGIIFNQVGARIGSYGYGAYGYHYGYSTYGYKDT